ncbi:hypothetical protein PACTADRAFT_852 [Pachysolen tannophilus NRRL Y-2460]|uniref:Glycerol uptake protein 1 n=1 Tax=Pachysolen tannophilus NRRL Y-2460 TaxID=669874 RepID=A0A1E4U302_PACTA|nr:hypothetical protein PACTADRAFT_852 [Pachysolen tannophilus NRRL Y-2460]
MNPYLSAFLSFFSLEALDSRLAPNSNLSKRGAIIKSAQPSKWSTLEFKIYMVLFIIFVPMMYKTAMDASNETNKNYYIYEGILSDGWIFGRKVDNSDSQYKFFRDNFPALVGLMTIHSLLRQLSLIFKVGRNKFDLVFGCIFLFAAHGFNSIRILLHLTINYVLGKYITNRKAAKLATWAYGILALFINDKYGNLRYVYFSPILAPLDNFRGIVSRWDVFFNFTLLKMLSFNFDYLNRMNELEAEVKQKSAPSSSSLSSSRINTEVEAKTKNIGEKNPNLDQIDGDSGSEVQNKSELQSEKIFLNDRERLDAPLQIPEYNISNYLAYITYAPLFIAGPIITFNDFIYQSYNTLPTINKKKIFLYALRLGFCILVMEFLLHYIYVVAVSKAKAWHDDTPFQISMIGLFNLNIIWLKLLIPWRLFRLWALIDGIDTPENMIRCMDNNYSAMAFWRAWHRSFNRWVIKYIYVPLGGYKYRILSSLCVFSFVAIWHDIELKLLIWGWMIVIFLLPEILANKYLNTPYYNSKWWFRHLCGVGAVLNIWMMMIANLFGFCLGKDGTIMFLKQIFDTWEGIRFFIISSSLLFVAVQVMFELREAEKRKGINVRC